MTKSKMESYMGEYRMSGSDNTVSRDKSNKSIVSQSTANEHSYAQALEGIKDSKNYKEVAYGGRFSKQSRPVA